MAEDIFSEMQKDPRFQSDLLIIGMIRNDIRSANLNLEIDPTKKGLNEELYEFDLNILIFEIMGFSETEIDDISLWYYFQIKRVLEEIKYKRITNELLNDKATKLYYELKKQKSG